MADQESKQMRTAEYWDGRYEETAPDQQLHEWYRSFDQLEDFFKEAVFSRNPCETTPKILHLGSGDSTIPYDLLARGYSNQLCVDFSESIVKRMAPRDPAIQWEVMDVRKMDTISTSSIDVAFDKGTFASMAAWGPTMCPPDIIREDISSYSREVFRVLKPGGIWCIVISHEPHYVNRLMKCEGTEWQNLRPPYPLGGSGFLSYYAYCFTKKPDGEDATAAN